MLAFIIVAATIALAGYWTLMFFAQRSILFPRPSAVGTPARPADAEQFWLPISGGRVEAWYLPPVGAAASPAPLLLYTHGNAELIDMWPAAFAQPRTWGVGVLLLEYPGYGRSEGSPSQDSITEAVEAAYDWGRVQPGINPKHIVAYGASLGGGAACALAARREVAALILESTFTSVRSFARSFAVPGFLSRDPFDNLAVVGQYRGPLLIFHGVHDEVIPVRHGRELAATAPQAEFHLLPCGHNDCPRPWHLIQGFLLAHGLLPSSTVH